jgi:hypothetical protein
MKPKLKLSHYEEEAANLVVQQAAFKRGESFLVPEPSRNHNLNSGNQRGSYIADTATDIDSFTPNLANNLDGFLELSDEEEKVTNTLLTNHMYK